MVFLSEISNFNFNFLFLSSHNLVFQTISKLEFSNQQNLITFTMKLFLSTTTALGLSTLIGSANGHGYMFEPLTRNYYAHVHGLSWGSQSGFPDKEYCHHCLNTKGPGSVCGTSEQGVNYDVWLDSNGEPMPWNSNGNIYQEGDVITISSFLASHHTGHMEVRACPHGRHSTQECFDRPDHKLIFVEDNIYDMPQGTCSKKPTTFIEVVVQHR